MELHEGQQFGRYRILRTFSQEGLATSYLAEDVRIGRQVAIKVVQSVPYLDGRGCPTSSAPTNIEPQLVRFPFKVTIEGKVALSINFYREQQWLHTVQLEFEGVDQSQLARTIYGR